MVKQITELTLSDFPNVYTLNSHIRLVTNISNIKPDLLGTSRSGYYIRVFNSSDSIPKFKSIYVAPQIDFYADSNTSSLNLPNTSNFREISSLDDNCITTGTLSVTGKWFNGTSQNVVWAYFVLDDTPHFTGTITNSLHDSTTYTKDDKDIITLKANDGYKIKNASLDYQPYPGAGNQSLGDFTISSDKLTATISIPDDVKNDKTINLTISGETSTDLEHINPTLKANNVTISITGNTVNLTANDGYLIDSAILDVGNSLFGDNTSLNFTVAPDKKTATVTITDESLIDPQQEYNLTVKTSIEQKLTVQYKYNSSLVSVTTTTSDYQVNTPFTLNATPSTGYTYDKVDSIFNVAPSDNVTINQTGTKATITLPDKQTYTITLKDPTKLPTQKKVYFSDYNYTIYIPNDTRGINGTGTNKDGFKVVPLSDIPLTNEVASTIFADINGASSAGNPITSSISSFASSGLALGKSILFITGIISRLLSRAR